MAWYSAGTASVTNGSPLVTGNGTAWVANVQPGWGLIMPDGRPYEILAVNSNTSLTLRTNYAGPTAAGQLYTVLPTSSFAGDLAASVSTLINSFVAVRDGPGQGKFGDGTVALPAITFSTDQDTGLYHPAVNVFGIAAGGNAKLIATTGAVTLLGNAGSGPDAGTVRLMTTGGALGQAAGVTFHGTFAGSTGSPDTNPRRVADIYAGFTGGWGAERLNFAVGTGVTNDAAALTTVRLWIDGVGNTAPGADNVQNLGMPGARWSAIYAGSGTINTSDERDKNWRGALTKAELAAARTIAREIGIYQFNDAVADKGKRKARLHAGVVAQQVVAAFEAEKLDPTRYGIVCHDAWEADERQAAGDRYGIRYDELSMFLIAAQEQRLVALEAA